MCVCAHVCVRAVCMCVYGSTLPKCVYFLQSSVHFLSTYVTVLCVEGCISLHALQSFSILPDAIIMMVLLLLVDKGIYLPKNVPLFVEKLAAFNDRLDEKCSQAGQ